MKKHSYVQWVYFSKCERLGFYTSQLKNMFNVKAQAMCNLSK